MSALLEAVLTAADSQVGVREQGRNDGPEVRGYLGSVGLGAGFSWCAAFVYWCFAQGAASLGRPNPCPRTAGALRLWDKAPPACRTDTPMRGDVFVIDHGHGLGHVGFIWEVLSDGKTLITVEGNTAPNGTREGDGVYKRARQVAEINRGYLDFTEAQTSEVA